jgi:gas vesicle protein GvpL/GvpF
MTSTYVYAVVDAADAPLDQTASDDLRLVVHGPLAAVVSTLPDAGVDGTAENITAHAEIVERLSGERTTLPVRFGVVVDDDEAVVDRLLRRHEQKLTQLLGDLDGRVELRLRARYEREELLRYVVAGDPGLRRYNEQVKRLPPGRGHAERIELGERVAAAVERQQAADAQQLLQSIAPAAVRHRVLPAPPELIALHAAFLVEEGAVDQFGAVVERATSAAAVPIVATLVGPLPPWDFTELEQGPN